MSEHDFLYSNKLIEKFDSIVKKYDIKHVVYVGLPPASVFRLDEQMWWYRYCTTNNIDYTIVEIFEPWAAELEEEGFNVVCRDVATYIPPKDSILLWSHGPEHVDKDSFSSMLDFFSLVYKNIFVAMPFGVWEQTSAVNPFEEHKWHAYPEDLGKLGFKYINTNGPKDQKGDLFGVYYD